MSFDIDPKDQRERILCYHAESDSLFEVWSLAELESINEPIDVVTGNVAHETRWRDENDITRKT